MAIVQHRQGPDRYLLGILQAVLDGVKLLVSRHFVTLTTPLLPCLYTVLSLLPPSHSFLHWGRHQSCSSNL